MNADEPAAPGTGPPFLFVPREMPYAELLYVHEIVDHAHAILCSIALVQVVQLVAGEAVTAEAVPEPALHYLLTVLDPARGAGFWFDAVVVSAAGAWVRLSCIGVAEATVHSTGSDQCRADHVCLC
jgi:hypothetical protein